MESSPWRCGSCGARFTSPDPAPRCPKCLKQSLVARDDAETPPAPVYLPAPAPEPEPVDPKPGATVFLACVPALVVALLSSGWFGARLDPLLALVLAVVTAPFAGWVGARDTASRIHASVAAMVGSVGIVAVTAAFTRGRPHVVNVALLLPIVVGALPGLLLFFVLRALAPRPGLRALVAALATAATVIAVATL
ncbi:MAG: hypothetical protein JWP97_2553 [Labilithrix sp.]|nr:hypothetical protein [Labilithrix sp.]